MSSEYHKYVVIAAPGEPDGQGGIIRQMDYLQRAWPQESDWKLQWLTTWSHGGCKPCRLLRAMLKLLWLQWNGRAHILHINLASQGSFYRKYLLAKLARFLRVPFVVHLHGGGFQMFYDTAPAAVQRRIEWLFYQAQHCVVLGGQWQHFLELRFRMPTDKITVCPNAVPDVAPAEKTNDVPHLLFVGHVLARKGMDELISALSQLMELPWRMTVAGSGDVERYRALAAEKGLGARVRFTGWLDAQGLEAQYKAADVLVLPSHVENQPLCVLEAMARGVAVVATKVGTVPELIDHGRTGLLVQKEDEAALKAAIELMIHNDDARTSIAEEARAEYEQRFTLDRYVKQWQGIYQETLSF